MVRWVQHKITLRGKASRYSAWFSCADGDEDLASMWRLDDAERIDAKGRSYSVTDAEREQLRNGPWSAFAPKQYFNKGA